ncbi:isocitrate lyase/phosphoenolpyruvate mutase family protein [Mucilaginibacter sp. PAMB04274]|uniref:isocitrate lyase/phosphoenolpyruvate mutase family protein n=1 Tax=Mucilaginibacter sp. PAMB04274 TaxID=3138568 RepID=UPI0031F68264
MLFYKDCQNHFETVIRRAKLYRDVGADGLFVTGIGDPAVISAITSAVFLPVNIVGGPNLATVESLAKAGIKRISMAVFVYRATYQNLEKAIKAVNTSQTLTPLF